MSHHQIRAILLDSGDTLIDEGTEIKNAIGEVQRAELIPGAGELLRELKRRGYPLALVADGPVASFTNGLGQHGLYDLFDAHAISGALGVDKPEARMFECALTALGVAPQDHERVLMVGNNLARDIAGANALGLTSVWLDWAPRRSKVPANALEVPQFTIREPLQLVSLLERMERSLAAGRTPRPLPPDASTIRRLAEAVDGIEIICHRAANQYAPENTYAAAQLCLDWGIDWVEIDVNSSADGVLYLLHGPSVAQTTNGSGYIADLSSSDVDQLDVGGWFSSEYVGQHMPRLDEFLRWIKGTSRVYLDVKRAHLDQLIALIRDLRMEEETFFWFGDDEMALEFSRRAPDLTLKINTSSLDEVAVAQKRYGARIVEVSLQELTPALQESCRQRGMKVMVFEEQADPVAYRRILDSGVQMVNLDHADLFVRVAADWLTQHPQARAGQSCT